MKLLLMFALLLNIADASSNEINHWVNKKEKTVHYVRRPLTKVVLQVLEASPKVWAAFSIDMSYEGNDPKINELKKRYPAYKVERISAKYTGKATIKIPSINLLKKVDILQNMEGPYFNHTIFLSKREYISLKKHINKTDDFFDLFAKNTVSIPSLSKVEEKILNKSTCRKLVKNGSDIMTFSKNYLELTSKISKDRSIRFKDTRRTLIDSILINCFEPNINGRYDSLTELLEQEIILKRKISPPRGITTKLKILKKIVPMVFQTSIEVI